jgi:D-xylulose reductase
MKSLVLESKGKLSLRDFPLEEKAGPQDLRIRITACGICGSDIHFYRHGAIGDYVVRQPLILGHEAAGVVVEKGEGVADFALGDLVCVEPGIPGPYSAETLEGIYNLDPGVVFWACPPDHGCLRETVVHPARFCFKLPGGMSAPEGAMIEPLAVGIEAARNGHIKPGDTALVIGSGTIGIMCALSFLGGGCSKVFITGRREEKLAIVGSYGNIIPVNVTKEDLYERINRETAGAGVDVAVEASGNPDVYPGFFRTIKRGGRAVLVGMMDKPVPVDVLTIQALGIKIESVFRYANCYGRAIALVNSGRIDVKRLISRTFKFDDAVAAYEFAAEGRADVIKVMIDLS